MKAIVSQIRIKGHPDRKWANCFFCLSIISLNNGETLLTGPVLDQAAFMAVEPE